MKCIWDLSKLSAVPRIWNAEDAVKCDEDEKVFFTEGNDPGKRPAGVSAIWYESERYHKKKTRVFAWLGIPKITGTKKIPGVVLVHGGGGTAFAQWVHLWNNRGYAAIAIDTEGHVPCAKEYSKWNQHKYSGPSIDNVFDNIDLPLKDQWTYHAVSAVIRGHSLLRSLPQVDVKRIGVCGISWGGYLACISMGLDKRFRFAVPIYGCGYLGEESIVTAELNKLGEKRRSKWFKCWDPSNYIPNAKLPTLWVTGSNDVAYSLGIVNHSYHIHGGKPTLSIGIRYGHSHESGWKRQESFAFADSCSGKGKPLIRIMKYGRENNKAFIVFNTQTGLKRVTLCYTNDEGKWKDRYWRTRKAIIKSDIASSIVLPEAKACFFNIVNAEGLIVSSPLIY
jgi:dienelactone hydrolase